MAGEQQTHNSEQERVERERQQLLADFTVLRNKLLTVGRRYENYSTKSTRLTPAVYEEFRRYHTFNTAAINSQMHNREASAGPLRETNPSLHLPAGIIRNVLTRLDTMELNELKSLFPDRTAHIGHTKERIINDLLAMFKEHYQAYEQVLKSADKFLTTIEPLMQEEESNKTASAQSTGSAGTGSETAAGGATDNATQHDNTSGRSWSYDNAAHANSANSNQSNNAYDATGSSQTDNASTSDQTDTGEKRWSYDFNTNSRAADPTQEPSAAGADPIDQDKNTSNADPDQEEAWFEGWGGATQQAAETEKAGSEEPTNEESEPATVEKEASIVTNKIRQEVCDIVITYVREKYPDVIRRIKGSQEMSAEQLVKELIKRREDIDAVFRYAVVEYKAAELVADMRDRIEAEFQRCEREGNLTQESNLRFMYGLGAIFLGNATAAVLDIFARQAIYAGGQVFSHQSPEWAVAAAAGAFASGTVVGAFNVFRERENDLHQLKYAFNGIHRNAPELDEDTYDFPTDKEQKAFEERRSSYSELITQLNKVEKTQLLGQEADFLHLVEQVAEAQSRLELIMAYRLETNRQDDESAIEYAARIYTRFNALRAAGSLELQNDKAAEIAAKQVSKLRKKAVSVHALRSALQWSAIGGLTGLLLPKVQWSPAWFSMTPLQAQAARDNNWGWAYEHITPEEAGVENSTAETEHQVESGPGPDSGVLKDLDGKPIDELIFYFNRKIGKNTSPEEKAKIEKIQSAVTDSRKEEELITQVNLLRKALWDRNSYFFISNKNPEGIDDKKQHFYRLYYLNLDRCPNPYANPDPQNEPSLATEFPPFERNTSAVPKGRFIVREYDPASLANPIPKEERGQFEKTWHDPLSAWRPLNRGCIEVGFDVVFPYGTTGALSQAFIKPTEIAEYAGTILNGNTVESIFTNLK